MKSLAPWALLAASLWASFAGAEEIVALTKPSEDVTLSFVQPGLIKQMCVKEGDEVKAGMVLARQDDEAERVEVAQLKALADDNVHIRAAVAQKGEKQVEYDKLKAAYEKKAVPEFDVKKAELEVIIAQLSLELAQFQHEQDQMKYENRRIQVERMKLVSPIDGKVEKISQKAGESAKVNDEAMRVVKVNPLWVEAAVPFAQAKSLKVGAVADVMLPDSAVPAAGRIVWVSAVADAASKTLKVRIELPNAAGRPAGEIVTVRFPQP